MISENDFDAAAFPELKALVDAVDEFPDGLIAELAGDVLTLEFDDGDRYIVNSHRSARQIWLAASLRAWHFDYAAESKTWIDPKTSGELWAVLSELITKKLNQPIELVRR